MARSHSHTRSKSPWTRWRSFPDPRQGELLVAPIGPGVYELRNNRNRRLVLIGCSKSVSARISSLLPAPLGSGTRNNVQKRHYVLKHLAHIEYRCAPCVDRASAFALERKYRSRNDYLYST